MEIGSEFWFDIKKIEKQEQVFNSFSDNNRLIYTSSGRNAISLCLKILNNQHKEVLLPAYICESVIEPFLANGYNIKFYDLNNDFSPRINIDKISEDTSIFFYMNYFGFQTSNDLKNKLWLLKQKNITIIEDVTHSFMTSKYSDMNDFEIASIRKWLGVPSGGFLWTSDNLAIENSFSEHKKFAHFRKIAMNQKALYMDNRKNIDENKEYLNIFYEAEKILDQDNTIYKIDKLSRDILGKTDFNKLKLKRRENYGILFRELKSVREIEIPFKILDKDTVPLFFPIKVKERAKLRSYLTSKNIFCPIHWPQSKFISSNLEYAQNLYDEILSIPCDQRYSKSQMKYVAEIIKEFFRNNEEI